MKRGLILCIALGVGCTRPTPAPVPRFVVAPCPEPPARHRPHLPIEDLSPESTPDQVARAYVVSIKLLMAYALELETVLDGYRTAPRSPDVRRQ